MKDQRGIFRICKLMSAINMVLSVCIGFFVFFVLSLYQFGGLAMTSDQVESVGTDGLIAILCFFISWIFFRFSIDALRSLNGENNEHDD